MLIGEAPGAAESKSGKPFQGQSGQLLRRELEAVGIDPEEVYITNMAKCRPPENRTPTNPELKACRHYLETEIDTVDPEYILLLGATALKFIKKTKITELRGTVFEVDNRKFMPVFHPAAALRDPGRLPGLRHDLQKFANLVHQVDQQETQIRWRVIDASNCAKFLDEFQDTKYFSFDCETTGLLVQDPEFDVNSISFTFDTLETWVLPLAKNERPDWAIGMLIRAHGISQGKLGIGHNGKYDNMSLMARYKIRFYLAFDTMMASHTFDENTPHGLKFLAGIHCNAPDYDTLTLKEKLGLVGDFNKVLEYNAYDSYYTFKLFQFYRDKFKRTAKLRRLFNKLVMPAARIFEEADFGGHYIHLDQFEQTRIDLTNSVNRTKAELQKMSGTRKVINWNSPAQIGELLFGKLGLEVTHYTDKGKPSTGESALLELKGVHPIADKLIEYRGYQKSLSTYIEGWGEWMVGHYLYLSTKLHGTVTGRYSSRLHQTPRDGTIRNLIGAPEQEGWSFVCADFSQIELRLAAEASQDQRLKFIFQTGGDVHAATASEVIGIPPDQLTKEQRKQGKPINFGFLYGMGWPKFRIYSKENYGVLFSDQEAKAYRDRFFDLYAGLTAWHERMRRKVREDGYVEYLSGRLRRLPGVFSQEKEVRAEAERQAINSPIQGFGSGDLKAMAMVAIHETFSSDVVRIKGEVHDSILMWVKTKRIEEILPRVKNLMENPPLFKEFGIELSVPLIVDLEVGTWGKGIKWVDSK